MTSPAYCPGSGKRRYRSNSRRKRWGCWTAYGKTTFALGYLPRVAGCRNFINADLIAAGLSPLAPEKEFFAASKIFLREIEEHVSAGEDFAFETTLSGRSYLRLIERLGKDGWRVELIYLALPNVEMSRMRVAERVAHGGHNIPLTDIERRYPRSLYNLLNLFSHRVDSCICFMNDGGEPTLVFEQQGADRKVIDQSCYDVLLNGAEQ